MKLSGKKFTWALTGEYVLGGMNEPSRSRLERELKVDPILRKEVSSWENHLAGLAEVLPPIRPPHRVWEAIESQIVERKGEPKSFWQNLEFWRPLALLSSAVALCLFLFISYRGWSPAPSGHHMIAYLNDPTSQPGWMMTLDKKDKMIMAKAMNPPPIGPNQDLELWMLPKGDQKPISLGMMPMSGIKAMKLTDDKYKILLSSAGLAVSLEPKGGSPTGAPTGPVLFQGALQEI